jgi:NAD(P)-dependent dehydrogenase (short-subunit alcohol dehydrogenase family)
MARVLVVGGGTGLGLASARALVDAGHTVFLTGRRSDVLAQAADLLGADKAGWQAGDATIEADSASVVAAAAERMGGLDGLVVSAGMSARGSVVDTATDVFRTVLDANLLPILHYAKHAIPQLTSGGSIVVISSITGSFPQPERAAYCTAKAGAIGLARQIALDYADRAIRVNSISPSLVLTDLSAQMLRTAPDAERMRAARLAQHPLGRLGTPEEIGAAVAFFMSPESAWITGQDFKIDGGLGLRAMQMRI